MIATDAVPRASRPPEDAALIIQVAVPQSITLGDAEHRFVHEDCAGLVIHSLSSIAAACSWFES